MIEWNMDAGHQLTNDSPSSFQRSHLAVILKSTTPLYKDCLAVIASSFRQPSDLRLMPWTLIFNICPRQHLLSSIWPINQGWYPSSKLSVWETVGLGGMKSAHSSLELPSGLFRRVLFSSPRGPQNSIAFVSWIPMCEIWLFFWPIAPACCRPILPLRFATPRFWLEMSWWCSDWLHWLLEAHNSCLLQR